IDAVLAAVDATKEPSLGKKYDVKGYPTVKYFKDGTLAFDADVRTEESIVNFMRDPKEPPPPPPPEKPWAEEDSAVVHLTEENFKSELRKKKNALVMFYAPCRNQIYLSGFSRLRINNLSNVHLKACSLQFL
ncbi:unnamed protein product, partial [Allacma fusca]